MDYVPKLIVVKIAAVGCKCIEVQRIYEFPIIDKRIIYYPNKRDSIDDIELKKKIICEYNKIIDQLECGKHPDLEEILEEMSLIEIYGTGLVLY